MNSKSRYIINPILFFIILLVSSCKIQHNFHIEPEQITLEGLSDLSDTTVNIEFFLDTRDRTGLNKSFFSKGRKVKSDSDFACINAQKHYKSPLHKALTKITTTYFKHSGVFKNAVFNKKGLADYTIVLELEEFAGELHPFEKILDGDQYEEYESKPFFIFIPNKFILWGKAKKGTLGYKADGYFDIQFSKVSIYHKSKGLICSPFEIQINEEAEYFTDTDCWSPYWIMDYLFKECSLELLEESAHRISDYQSN